MPVIDAAEQQANGFFLVGSMVILLAKWIVQSAMYHNRKHYKAMPVIGKNDLIKQLCQDKIMKRVAKDCPDNKSMVGAHDPYQKMINGGVISLKDKRYKVALVYGQMDEPLGACARVALTGLIVAEYFRDQEDRHVLLFMVNIFRSTQAGSEVSALLGRTPSAMGYQPTLAADMSSVRKRITTTKKSSITSVQAIYVPAYDWTYPAPATTFASTVLSRSVAERGTYPAVDPLDSISRIIDPNVIGTEHYGVARGVQEILQDYKSLQDIIAIVGLDEFSEEDKLKVARVRKIERVLSQPFQIAEVFTNNPGKLVPIAETISGLQDMLAVKLMDCQRRGESKQREERLVCLVVLEFGETVLITELVNSLMLELQDPINENCLSVKIGL